MRFPQLPADEREGLRSLALLSDEQLGALLSRLVAAPLNVNRDRFSASVQQVEGVDPGQLLVAVSSLLFLHAYLSGTDVAASVFVRDVCESLSASKLEPELVNRLRVILPAFMELEGLRLQAKAVDLQVDHARTFQGAKVLTDLRPVFDMGLAERVVGGLVFHTLKVNYFSTDGPKEIFIAMDEGDLTQLRKAIEKAEVKGKTLRETVVAKLGLNDFGTSTNTDEQR